MRMCLPGLRSASGGTSVIPSSVLRCLQALEIMSRALFPLKHIQSKVQYSDGDINIYGYLFLCLNLEFPSLPKIALSLSLFLEKCQQRGQRNLLNLTWVEDALMPLGGQSQLEAHSLAHKCILLKKIGCPRLELRQFHIKDLKNQKIHPDLAHVVQLAAPPEPYLSLCAVSVLIYVTCLAVRAFQL